MDGQGAATAAHNSSLHDAGRGIKGNGVPWVLLGRHDLLAALHGLTLPQKGVWADLIAEALSAGSPDLSLERCKEVAGRHWEALRDRLIATRRVEISEKIVTLIWVQDALADAAKRIAKARKMRAGHDDARR